MSDSLHTIVANSTLLTVNSRLSRHLAQGHEQWQLARGKHCWPTPVVLPWNAWLKQQWQQLGFSHQGDVPTLLSDIQAQALWEQVIRDSPQGAALLNISATAKSARQAWRLLKQWRQPLDDIAQEQHPDILTFCQWAQAFQKQCRDRHYLDEDSLPDWVIVQLAQQQITLDKAMYWLGFDELTPQQQSLMQAQRDAGAQAERMALPLHQAQPRLLPCADSRAEIEAAAQWLRRLLEEGASGPIGIVVPDLAGMRRDIERIFDEVLTPASITDLSGPTQRPFNLSLGTALADLPMIHSALNLLSLLQGDWPLERWSQYLLSPFGKGADAELAARAQLDARLRRHGEARLNLRQVLYWAERENNEAGNTPLAQLQATLVALREQMAALSARQSASAWSEQLQTLLQITGWPGERELDSEGFQTGQAWKALLATFGSLEQVLPALTYRESLRHLRQLATTTLFQPQNRGEPVQVLGVLEAVGLAFSHCWVMGLHDGVWPAAPRPNPFLPVELQRRLQMPHASAERELAYAQHISQRLFAAAPEVIVSYPQREGDAELRPSPLLAGLEPLADPPAPGPRQRYSAQQFAARRMTSFSDWRAPPLAGSQASGGTSIFKDQAACPFRAFARHRLGAEGLAEPVSGLDAAERGNLVHKVLEKFWTRIRSQAELDLLADDVLQQQVEAVVQEVVAAEAAIFPQIFTERFRHLEQARLGRLTLAWLQQERAREPFSVAGVEVKRTINIGGLQLEAKADRIDRLKSGGEMIIDYKTGDPKVHTWFGTRPDEPQLPLYAISHDEAVAGVAFARLNPAGIGFRGLSRHANEAQGIAALHESKYDIGKDDWQALLDEWRKVLTQLAENFRHGLAEVDPKEGATTCQYCECAPLCRINELNGLGLKEEAADE